MFLKTPLIVSILLLSFSVAGCVASQNKAVAGENPDQHPPYVAESTKPGKPPIDHGRPAENTPASEAPSNNSTKSNNTTVDAGNVSLTPIPDAGMKLDVGENVPDKDLAIIREGLAKGQKFIDEQLVGGIPDSLRANITVKIVATGLGNEEEGGGGACCSTFSMSTDPPGGARLFFDVAHTDWVNRWGGWPADPQREESVAHEFTHAWQWSLGCIKQTDQPLGMWMNEGIAEQVGYAVMIEDGAFSKAEVLDFMEQSAKQTGEWFLPLATLSMTQAPVWPGHIGYLALEFAMNGSNLNLTALRNICTAVSGGSTREEAFQATFGTSMEVFYAEFQVWVGENSG